jgi:hypothetical protein
MLVWGIWWQDAFWFSTGPRTRKAKNIAAHPFCVIGTERADEAVILGGAVQQVPDRELRKQFAVVYNRKYGGDVLPLLKSSGGLVFGVEPRVVFGQDEHAENFADACTPWVSPTSDSVYHVNLRRGLATRL